MVPKLVVVRLQSHWKNLNREGGYDKPQNQIARHFCFFPFSTASAPSFAQPPTRYLILSAAHLARLLLLPWSIRAGPEMPLATSLSVVEKC